MSGGYIECACCATVDMVSDGEVLCDDCVQAECEPQEGGELDGCYVECQVPFCPDCEQQMTYCTSDEWVDNCDDDCPRFQREGRTHVSEKRKPRRAPPIKFRVPLAWLRASRWSERLRPHVLSKHFPTPGLVYNAVEVLPKLCACGDGGYPLYYVASTKNRYRQTCSLVCAECATNAHEWADEDTRVTEVDVNWEDKELYCDECNERIPSAYAEDDLPESQEVDT